MKKKKKSNHMVLFIIPTTIIICFFLLFNIINLLRYKGGNPNEIVYEDNIKSDIKYNVYLKPNDFITDRYITDQYSFIASLIEYIKTSFMYEFIGNEKTKLIYDYYIKGTIISQNPTDNNKSSTVKPLWDRDFILLDHQKGETVTTLKVNQELNLGIDYYNNLLETFRKTLNLSLDSRLDVVLSVSIDTTSKDNKPIHKDHYLTMSIPLGVSVFDITTSKSFPNQEITYRHQPKPITTSYMLIIIYLILMLLIIGGTIYYLKITVNHHKNEFKTKINRILKEYDDRIVTVTNFIRYQKMEIVNIPSFEELLTLSDETLEPIIYWEKREHSNREAWFSVIRDKILYCYIVSYHRKEEVIHKNFK